MATELDRNQMANNSFGIPKYLILIRSLILKLAVELSLFQNLR